MRPRRAFWRGVSMGGTKGGPRRVLINGRHRLTSPRMERCVPFALRRVCTDLDRVAAVQVMWEDAGMRARVRLTCLVPHRCTTGGLGVVRAWLEDWAVGVGRIGEHVGEGIDHRPQKIARAEEGEGDDARDMCVRTGKYTNATTARRASYVDLGRLTEPGLKYARTRQRRGLGSRCILTGESRPSHFSSLRERVSRPQCVSPEGSGEEPGRPIAPSTGRLGSSRCPREHTVAVLKATLRLAYRHAAGTQVSADSRVRVSHQP